MTSSTLQIRPARAAGCGERLGLHSHVCECREAHKLPAVIRTEEENERLIDELEQFDRHYEELTPEEREYSELLTVLVEPFEDANYALEGSTSGSRLRSPMEEHGLPFRPTASAQN